MSNLFRPLLVVEWSAPVRCHGILLCTVSSGGLQPTTLGPSAVVEVSSWGDVVEALPLGTAALLGGQVETPHTGLQLWVEPAPEDIG